MSQEIQNEIIAEIAPEEQIAAVEQADEAIALGGSEQIADVSAADEKQEEPKKKKSKAGKVVGGILIGLLALVLVLVIGVGILAAVLINKATVPVELPEKAEASNVAMFGAEAAVNLIADDQIVVGNDDIQMLMDKVMGTVSASLEGTPVRLDELFCLLADDQGTIYGQVYISELNVKGVNIKLDKNVAFKATFDVNFENPCIVAQVKQLQLGELDIPVNLITTLIGGVELPAELRIEGDEIYYDVSGLDTMLDEVLPQVMESGLGDNVFSSFLSDLLVEKTDVEITGADIVGDELIINGHLF